MIGSRTRTSLAQLLELQQKEFYIALVNKHGMQIPTIKRQQVSDLTICLLSANDEGLLSLIEEMARTGGDLRSRVSPKYCYDERFLDLVGCLQLDGYILADKSLIQTDPSICDAPPLDDDLLRELRASSLSGAEEIVRKINSSSELFRTPPPNYNACLNDIRVALETLAKVIATSVQSSKARTYDSTKWGSVIGFLKAEGFITPEEEQGLVGVYRFISPGSHLPIRVSDEQMARLGRSLALNMCWFLIKNYKATL